MSSLSIAFGVHFLLRDVSRSGVVFLILFARTCLAFVGRFAFIFRCHTRVILHG
jgi:hypothetical protein